MIKIFNHKILLGVFVLGVFSLANIGPAECQGALGDPPQEVEETKTKVDPCESKVEKVTQGTLATVGSYGSGGATVKSSAGNSAIPGDEVSAVLGSVQFKTDTKCEAILSNKSECFKYSVSFSVYSSTAGSEESSSMVTSNSLSLPPGTSKSVSFSCKRDLNYSLRITNSKSSKSK